MKNLKNPLKIASVSIALVCLLSLSLSSCLKDNNSYVVPATAGLMVIQGSPGAPAEDFYLNNNKVNWQPFNYGDELGYFNAYTGVRTATLYNYGTPTQIASNNTLHLNANTNYSLFLANTYSSPDFILLTDSIARPSSGNGSVRFVNVSPDAGAADLSANSNTLAANIAYKGSSSFVPVTGNMSYTFQIKQTGTNTILAADTVAVKTGFVYTIWLHGMAAGSGSSKLSAGTINNAYFY